jgi:transcriptional regulator with XRE-family HTH domain
MSKPLMQRRIGDILKRLRTEKNLSRAKTAELLGTKDSKYKHYENGTVQKLEPMLMRAWVERLGAPTELADEVERMALLTNGNVTRWELDVPPWFAQFIELEHAAATIDIYDGDLITGLLQVPGYIEGTLRVSAVIAPGEADRVIAVRKKRQKATFGRPGGPPRMRIIINEAAIERIRGEVFFEEQMSRLDEAAAIPGVEIYVLPFAAGLHASMNARYTLMTFEEQDDPELVYTDGPAGAQFESDRRIVARYRRVFTATLEDAVPYPSWRNWSTQ